MNTFFRLHSVGEFGSYSEPLLSLKDLAVAVLRRMQENLTSLRLAELEFNAERTLGVRKVQEIKIRRPFRGTYRGATGLR